MRTLPTLVLAAVAALILSACGGSDEPAQTGIAALKAGTCFDTVKKDATVDYPVKLKTIDCDELHSYEVMSNKDLGAEDDPFPGATESKAKAECQDVFKSYVGTYDTQSKDVFLSFVFPTEKEWGEGKRAVICFAGGYKDDDIEPRKGSVKDSAAGEGDAT